MESIDTTNGQGNTGKLSIQNVMGSSASVTEDNASPKTPGKSAVNPNTPAPAPLSNQLNKSIKSNKDSSLAVVPKSVKPATMSTTNNQINSKLIANASQIKMRKRTQSIMPSVEEDGDGEIDAELRPVLAGFQQLKFVLISNASNAESLRSVNEDLNNKILDNFEKFSNPEQRKTMGNEIAKIGLVEELVKFYQFVAQTNEISAFTMEVMDDEDDEDVKMLKDIRTLLWNFSDSSTQLAMEIAEKTDMFSVLAVDLQEIYEKDFKKLNNDCFPFLSAVGIIHNCARADVSKGRYSVLIPTDTEGDQQRKESDQKTNTATTIRVELIDCLLPFLGTKDTYTKMITLLALAHMVNDEQNTMLMADGTLFDFVLDMIKKAMKSKERRSVGFSVQELLDGLAHLAKNDANKSIITEKKALPIVKELVLKGSTQEQIEAVKVIWELAFNKKNKKYFLDDKELWKKLYKLQEDPNDELAKTAQGACFVSTDGNISGHVPSGSVRKPITAPVKGTPSDTKRNEHGYIMISYNWDNQKTLLKVRDRLQNRGFFVWMDVDNMEGDILEAMGRAVEGADLVLMCYSEKYKDSKNCRTEAQYAYSCNKAMIPLLMQSNYRPDGWLGALVGTRLYFEFTQNFNFDKKMEELTREIEGHMVPKKAKLKEIVTAVKPAAASQNAEDKLVILEWKTKDMEKWLQDNRLEKFSGLTALTGEELAFLYKLFRKAPEFFYKCLEEKLGLKSLEELMRFTNAVEKLSVDYPAIHHLLL